MKERLEVRGEIGGERCNRCTAAVEESERHSTDGIGIVEAGNHHVEFVGAAGGEGGLAVGALAVVLPIQCGALVTGVLLPFISGIKGLSLFVILAVPSTDVLTTYSLRLVDYHYTQAANAVVLIVAALAYFGALLGQRLARTNLADGLGG